MDGAPLEHIDIDDTWGEQPFGAPMPRAFRLSDAERIATLRLDGAAEGSLKEALATKIVEVPDEAASLGERLSQLAATATEAAAKLDAPTPSAPQPEEATAIPTNEVDFGWFGAVPPAHAVPCFEEREPDMDLIAAFASPPLAVSAPMPTPVRDASEIPAPALDQPPAAPNAPIEAPRPQAEASLPAADADVDAAHPALEAAPEPKAPLLALPEDPNLEPIVTAYAASARLAADAAAASQALFELQRLLNQQRLEASPELSVAMEAHGFAGLEAIPAAQQPEAGTSPSPAPVRAPDPVTDTSLAPPRVIQQTPPAPQRTAAAPPPLPLPLASRAGAAPPSQTPLPSAMPASPHAAAAAGKPRKAASRPPASARTGPPRAQAKRVPPSRHSRRADSFDLRGFAAGFVLSGAIGVVLYFVMATS